MAATAAPSGFAVARRSGGVVRDLQADLQLALAGWSPEGPWGSVQSAKGLAIAVCDLTLCIILDLRLKVEPQIELPEPKPGQAYAPIYEPITPAALSSATAFGILASVAAVLRTLARGAEGRERWRPDRATPTGWARPRSWPGLHRLGASGARPAARNHRDCGERGRRAGVLEHTPADGLIYPVVPLVKLSRSAWSSECLTEEGCQHVPPPRGAAGLAGNRAAVDASRYAACDRTTGFGLTGAARADNSLRGHRLRRTLQPWAG